MIKNKLLHVISKAFILCSLSLSLSLDAQVITGYKIIQGGLTKPLYKLFSRKMVRELKVKEFILKDMNAVPLKQSSSVRISTVFNNFYKNQNIELFVYIKYEEIDKRSFKYYAKVLIYDCRRLKTVYKEKYETKEGNIHDVIKHMHSTIRQTAISYLTEVSQSPAKSLKVETSQPQPHSLVADINTANKIASDKQMSLKIYFIDSSKRYKNKYHYRKMKAFGYIVTPFIWALSFEIINFVAADNEFPFNIPFHVSAGLNTFIGLAAIIRASRTHRYTIRF